MARLRDDCVIPVQANHVVLFHLCNCGVSSREIPCHAQSNYIQTEQHYKVRSKAASKILGTNYSFFLELYHSIIYGLKVV